MKKVTLVVSSKHLTESLERLRGLGLLHIQHIKQPQDDSIDSLKHKTQALDKALLILEASATKNGRLDEGKLASSLKEIIELDRNKNQGLDALEQLRQNRSWYREWGNVSYRQIDQLKSQGIFIKLYACDKASLKRISPEKIIHIVSRNKSRVLLALVSTSQQEFLNFEEIEVPHDDEHSLERKISNLKNKLKDIDDKLKEFSGYHQSLVGYKKELLKKLEFHQIKFGAGHAEQIAYLKGFCPQDKVSQINQAAQHQGWAIITQEPDNLDEVPTLIKNPKWVEMIKPVFKFLGTLPGYKEYDISVWFLLFFSLFFAMLIGDAGYGLIFVGLTFLAQKKFKKAPKEPFFLMYVLSGATIIWGALTGTWFGYEKIANLPLFNFMVIDNIDSFVSENQLFMIHFCFIIGVIHLTIAHAIRVFRFINSLLALAQVGWICIVWSMFFVAGKLVLNKPLPGFALGLGAFGAILVILFSNVQKNILKGAALSFADLPLGLISTFSDIVSYLRLFAVGYASVAVASTFNNMALSIGFNNILVGLISGLILFLGHALNIVLGIMAVIVHGVRLNMLEFAGHLNMQWSGIDYKPFSE
jgi:V/A-type H+-transporting ATPase subunit I